MKKIIWIGVVVLIIIGIFFLAKPRAVIEPPLEAGVIHSLDHARGNLESKVVITEYSDFQCPACKTYYPVMRQLTTEFEDRVAFIFRHFPLTAAHPNAELAARAAEAAGKQDKFWEMHDLLFEKQNEWSNVADIAPIFESYAALLGISVEQFNEDLRSGEVRDFVQAQKAHALKLGLPGTPTFFIGDKRIKNPASVDEFRTLINQQLEL